MTAGVLHNQVCTILGLDPGAARDLVGRKIMRSMLLHTFCPADCEDAPHVGADLIAEDDRMFRYLKDIYGRQKVPFEIDLCHLAVLETLAHRDGATFEEFTSGWDFVIVRNTMREFSEGILFEGGMHLDEDGMLRNLRSDRYAQVSQKALRCAISQARYRPTNPGVYFTTTGLLMLNSIRCFTELSDWTKAIEYGIAEVTRASDATGMNLMCHLVCEHPGFDTAFFDAESLTALSIDCKDSTVKEILDAVL